MNVGVLVFVEMRETVDDRLRLLRRRRVVEPDERLAMHLLLQNREVALHAIGIEGRAAESSSRVGRVAGRRSIARAGPARSR